MNGWKYTTEQYLKNVQAFESHFKSKLFRPPYGKIRNEQGAHLKEEYRIIMWDILSGDYNHKLSPETCLYNCTKRLRNGSVIVFHDSKKAENNLRNTLPGFIEFALQKEFVFSKF